MTARARTFEQIIPHILAVEGGIGPHSAYGIDINAWNSQYHRAVAITNTQGVQAGRDYAVAFYKEHFWNKHNMESVPEEVRDVVFDTIVNHSSRFSNFIKQAAERGATRADILHLREEEYKRLATSNPEKYGKYLKGWMNRLNTFRDGGSGYSQYAASNYPTGRPELVDEQNVKAWLEDLMRQNPAVGMLMMFVIALLENLKGNEFPVQNTAQGQNLPSPSTPAGQPAARARG